MILAATAELLQLIWVAPLAVVSVATTFSLALLGTSRSGERRRGGHTGAATAYGALGALCGLAFVALVVLAIGLIIAS